MVALEGFERNALTRALERRTVVQGTLMRATIHLVSAADYWMLTAAIRDARKKAFLDSRRPALDEDDLGQAAATVRKRLKAGEQARKPLMKGLDNTLFNGANVWQADWAGLTVRPVDDALGLPGKLCV